MSESDYETLAGVVFMIMLGNQLYESIVNRSIAKRNWR